MSYRVQNRAGPGNLTRGFTLVELLLVISLMIVIGAIAVPALTPLMEQMKLNADSRQIAYEMRKARQEAIMEGKPQTLEFYIDSRIYQRLYGNRYHLSPGIEYGGTTTFAPLYKYGPPACEFSASGVPSHAGTVTLKNQWGDKRYIIVSVATGRIRVSDQPPESWEDSDNP